MKEINKISGTVINKQRTYTFFLSSDEEMIGVPKKQTFNVKKKFLHIF